MFAIKRNNELVKHVVFESANTNYKKSSVCVLTLESIKSAEELISIWPDAEIVDVSNNPN